MSASTQTGVASATTNAPDNELAPPAYNETSTSVSIPMPTAAPTATDETSSPQPTTTTDTTDTTTPPNPTATEPSPTPNNNVIVEPDRPPTYESLFSREQVQAALSESLPGYRLISPLLSAYGSGGRDVSPADPPQYDGDAEQGNATGAGIGAGTGGSAVGARIDGTDSYNAARLGAYVGGAIFLASLGPALFLAVLRAFLENLLSKFSTAKLFALAILYNISWIGLVVLQCYVASKVLNIEDQFPQIVKASVAGFVILGVWLTVAAKSESKNSFHMLMLGMGFAAAAGATFATVYGLNVKAGAAAGAVAGIWFSFTGTRNREDRD
ncbi:hypothetical protein HK102_013164 [Quaeritorhiza haematococci]|nr:hypothetical protein HK102_013164 [Quaeritorhiza haematococci]